MLRSLYIATLAVAVTGCATQEVTLLVGSRSVHGDGSYHDTAAELTLTQRIGKRGVCSVSHTSNPAKGNPLNDSFDISHDFAGCGVRWGGLER